MRYGVGLARGVSVNVTYRHYEFENDDLPFQADEDVKIRALLVGVGYHMPLTKDFALVGNASVGPIRFESSLDGVSDDTGLLFSAEGAATARLHEMMRFKIGVILDFMSTDFHEDSTENMIDLSWMVGLEIGGW